MSKTKIALFRRFLSRKCRILRYRSGPDPFFGQRRQLFNN